ncbi:hypothetical protein L3Q82_013900 [Scortum barcoo]|uniref:Uncharacterized protein n=1 Tax=Scortum barcoo TaxID=214431 RepID=A0ACB8VVB2_9TELE|nr:hypothetical protein L3Q82_013900 [Scortum barcoo]
MSWTLRVKRGAELSTNHHLVVSWIRWLTLAEGGRLFGPGLCMTGAGAWFCIAGSKSDLFSVHVGLRQGCPLSPVLFIIFMDRISRRSQGPEGVRFGNHRISSLLFADDVVLLASSSQEREIDRRIGAGSAVMRSVYRTVVVKKALSRKAKLSIYRSIYASHPHLWS